MKQTTIPVKPDVRILVKCSSDLSVEGNDSSTLVVIVEQGDCLRMREENGLFRIMSDTDCRVMIPASATVTVEKTGGDCHLSNLIGRVVVGKIGSDLEMENIGGASVESVGGDCKIHNATGAIELARIGDSLVADGVQALLAGSVGSNVRLINIHGKVEVSAGDEISIQVAEAAVPEIRAKAGSDIEFYLSKDANCQLNLVSGGEEIKVHAGGQEADLDDREFSAPIGEGGAMVFLTAGDSIRVSDEGAPKWDDDEYNWGGNHWKDFGFEIRNQVKKGLKIASNSMEQALHQAEAASRQAGKQVERALRDLDDRGFNVGSQRKVVGFSMDGEKTSPTPKAGPTDEERMLVLKMLQEKKITVEEAEKLLNVLDR